jgi:hypothetical protein
MSFSMIEWYIAYHILLISNFLILQYYCMIYIFLLLLLVQVLPHCIDRHAISLECTDQVMFQY